MAGFHQPALGEELPKALAQIDGPNGVRVLRWALCELPLDGETALAIADRLVVIGAAERCD